MQTLTEAIYFVVILHNEQSSIESRFDSLLDH